jgi:hypothetical protein
VEGSGHSNELGEMWKEVVIVMNWGSCGMKRS